MSLDDVAQKRRRQSLAKVGWAHNQRADLLKPRLNLLEFSNGGETTVQPDAKEAGLSARDLRGCATQRHEVHNAENGSLDTIGSEHDGPNRVCHIQGRMVELDNLAGGQRWSPSNYYSAVCVSVLRSCRLLHNSVPRAYEKVESNLHRTCREPWESIEAKHRRRPTNAGALPLHGTVRRLTQAECRFAGTLMCLRSGEPSAHPTVTRLRRAAERLASGGYSHSMVLGGLLETS